MQQTRPTMTNDIKAEMETITSVTELLTSQPRRPPKGTDVEKCLTQSALLQITLDGPSIALTILGLVAAIQFFQPSITCMLVVLLPLPWIIYNDFQNFLFLGPGGTPSTFGGYLRIAYLRLFALSDPYTAANVTQDTYPRTGLHKKSTSWLPIRQGARPNVAGIAPHRQTDQAGSLDMDGILRATLDNVAKSQPDFFTIGQSCFEKKGLALFARHPINNTCNGEICHVHHVGGFNRPQQQQLNAEQDTRWKLAHEHPSRRLSRNSREEMGRTSPTV